MSSELLDESSVLLSAAATTVEAGKKRGRPPAGQVTVKLDPDPTGEGGKGRTVKQLCQTRFACEVKVSLQY